MNQSIILTGETVTITYTADPTVGLARFVLHNDGPELIEAEIKAAWLETGNERQTIAEPLLFEPNQLQSSERQADPRTLQIEPDTTVKFGISFQPIPYEPRFGEAVAVGVQVLVGDMLMEANCPLQYMRRWPLEES